MEQPKRKRNRLRDYDYSSSGAYFITICTKDKTCMFWDDNIPPNLVGATIGRPELSQYGKIANDAILNIESRYPSIFVDNYVIMPNHIHLLLRIEKIHNQMSTPSISTVVQQMKGYVTKQIGFSLWQKLFHDHIIRNKYDYDRIWHYISTNPIKWQEDCFYK